MNIRSYMSLFRVPSVWSAMSNIFAGFLIAGGSLFSGRLLAGMFASSLMIMAGMALNDIADKSKDANERPERPLPSGKVTLKAALWLSISMLILAILIVGYTHLLSIIPAALLAYSIYLYNFINKNGVYGPLNMGMCRVFNFTLGLTLGFSQGELADVSGFRIIFVLFTLGLYTAMITYLARDEARGNTRDRIHWFFGGITAWLIMWLIFILALDKGVHQILALILLFGVSIYLMPPFVELLKDPGSKNTQKSVTTLLLLMPVLDSLAMFSNGVNSGLAVLALIFVPLTYFTAKYVKIT